MKPMLASDVVEDKLRFPLLIQPKIDGVRALNITGRFTGRSLKGFKNKHVTDFFSHSALIGLDGEVAAESAVHPDLCRLTTSALGTIAGEPYVLWHLFDYVTPGTRHLPYIDRYAVLAHQMKEITQALPHIGARLRLVPSTMIGNIGEYRLAVEAYEAQGYEGAIIRDPNGQHKAGRSTVREGGLLRAKSFVDFELVVTEIVEGETNLNEATINELGLTERSTHQANMIPNGLIGTLKGTLCADVLVNHEVFLHAGEVVTISAGRLTELEREYYFKNPDKIIGRVAKAKFFPKGMKDKLRFPNFQSFRSEEDL